MFLITIENSISFIAGIFFFLFNTFSFMHSSFGGTAYTHTCVRFLHIDYFRFAYIYICNKYLTYFSLKFQLYSGKVWRVIYTLHAHNL